MSLFGKSSNEVAVTVDGGYRPDNFKLKAGEAAKVTFTRVSDVGCVDKIIFNGETRELPLNQPVSFEFTPEKGEHIWSCGMEMVHGKYIVK